MAPRARRGRRFRFLGLCAVTVAMVGCGPFESAQSDKVFAHTAGWVMPEAKREDLLYVATGGNVYVLSYPRGKLVGTLGIAGANLCSDKNGNVYVPTSGYEIFEYAHGGFVPIRELKAGDIPLGCAVDPMTGNLAVTNEGSGAGEVAIFPNAQEPAKWYRDPQIDNYGLCGYDDRGNLFLDGSGTTNVFAELPDGSSTFTNFTLNNRFDRFGSVQWDGRYITLTNPSTHEIFRLRLSGSSLKVIGTSRVRAWTNSYSGHWPYVQTWLERDTFIGQSGAYAVVGLWAYPAGGKPRSVTRPFTSGTVNIYGVTISKAAHGG
jgi:hypothetical protein